MFGVLLYPPSQKATGVNPWMNAKRVTLRSFSEAGYASAGFAEASEDAMAVKPWSFTYLGSCGAIMAYAICERWYDRSRVREKPALKTALKIFPQSLGQLRVECYIDKESIWDRIRLF